MRIFTDNEHVRRKKVRDVVRKDLHDYKKYADLSAI
jgi:hypothetical protein